MHGEKSTERGHSAITDLIAAIWDMDVSIDSYAADNGGSPRRLLRQVLNRKGDAN